MVDILILFCLHSSSFVSLHELFMSLRSIVPVTVADQHFDTTKVLVVLFSKYTTCKRPFFSFLFLFFFTTLYVLHLTMSSDTKNAVISISLTKRKFGQLVDAYF